MTQPDAPDGLLLVLPVPVSSTVNGLMLESQACNGADLWADHFEHLTIAAPSIPAVLADKSTTVAWKPITSLRNFERITFEPLPWAYTVQSFLRHLFHTRTVLESLITRHRYLHFAIGGLIGDWATQAASLARGMHRKYAIWTDRVEHKAIIANSRGCSLSRRIKTRLESPLMRLSEHAVINSCSVGLFHGAETFQQYSLWCKNPHLVHDIHVSQYDHIPNDALDVKRQSILSGAPLAVVYAGRAAPEKAPIDWLRAVARCVENGVLGRAVWLGDGPMLNEMRAFVRKERLEHIVSLPGFISDRSTVLQMLRESHVMLFTHITPESPRCLIEALVSGIGLIGYQSAYARDIAPRSLQCVDLHNWKALGDLLARLSHDRSELIKLIDGAMEDGRQFTDDAVFLERSMIMKAHL